MRTHLTVWSRYLGLVTGLLVCGQTLVADAQTSAGPDGSDFDRVRASGILWVGTLAGRIVPQTEALPSFIAIDDLGITDTESGWLTEGDVGLARRHRLRVSGSNRSNAGSTTVEVNVDIAGVPVPVPIPVTIETEIRIKEFEANYNFLVVANSRIDAGVLAGVGYFDAAASAFTPIGDASQQLDTPFPNLGGNALINPRGRLRGYVEVTGIPKVTVDDLSGWKLSIIARAEFFVTQHVGVLAGFRSYEIDLDNVDVDVDLRAGFKLRWQGLVVGGTVRF